MICGVSTASAAVTHVYQEGPSKELAKGVPTGSGCDETPPLAEPEPCLTGALTGADAIAADKGSVWVADFAGGHSRVDRFDETTGAFEGPQLDEEPVAGATGLGGELAVGHAEFGGKPGEQVYAGSGNLAVFDGATGKLLSVWKGANTPAGSFGGEKGVAVDASTSFTDPAKGDVYVVADLGQEKAGNAVDVFDPEKEVTKAGEEPAKPIAVIEGTCEAQGAIVGEPGCKAGEGLVPFVFPHKVAVSPSNGDVYVADIIEDDTAGHRSVVDVFEPTGVPGAQTYKLLSTITEANGAQFGAGEGITGLAVDGEGDLYIALGNGSGNTNEHIVYQFNAAGTLVSRLEGPPTEAFSDVTSVAADPEGGGLFVGDGGSSFPVRAFGKSETIPDVAVTEPTEVHATHVTLNGTVKLDEAGPAKCVFEYGTTTSYGKVAPCVPPEVTEAEETALGQEPIPVKATIGLPPEAELQPDTTYFYRVRALNKTGVPSEEDHGKVTTSGPGLDGESASEVASTAASLDATINPDGSNTSYYFQYSETNTEGCEATASSSSCPTLPAPPGEALGSSAGEQNVSQRLQGLAPGRTYHYRVVVLSEPKPADTEVFPEADRTFTTQPAAAAAALPDGRRWELVSPPDKHGALIGGINFSDTPSETAVIESSLSGGTFTYAGSNPTETDPLGYYSLVQMISTRGASGWSSQDVSLPHSNPTEPGNEYQFFSEDLSLGLATNGRQEFTSLKPDVFPPDSEGTPYVRHDLTCSSSPGTCYQPLVTGCPAAPAPCEPLLREDADVPQGTVFDPGLGVRDADVEFAGASPDLKHVVMESDVPLKPGAAAHALYEWSADAPLGQEELQPVSVLPESEGGGTVVGELGERPVNTRGGENAPWAVSADGSRVFWSTYENGLYMRDMTHGHSLVGGEQIPGETLLLAAGAADFQVASSDGARVLYTEGGDLDVCEVGEGPSGELLCDSHDLTPGSGVVGRILGASEDGSYVYFVSNSVLGDGAARGATAGNCLEKARAEEPAASAGESCNVYVAHYEQATGTWEAPLFIATLSGNDGADWSPAVAEQTARVSPDGRWLTFMSDRSLTGYDNRDAHSGKPDQEVFLYHAPESPKAGSGTLVCASCNPTGARPDGIENGKRRLAIAGVWGQTAWLAANVPSWTAFFSGRARYQSRFLSNSGRLFFNSSDALVPGDINNNEDVYQWEPSGVGSCSSSAPGFASATGGCVSLISSGTSGQESAFLDASENGDDVFFLTAEPLVKKDTDTAYDVYDAHVCGAEGVPCTPEAASPSPCETADECRTASPPQPEIFGAPASATFSGPGNPAPPPPPPAKPKTAAQIKAEKLAKALKSCRKDKKKAERQACEKTARKAYAAKTSAKKSNTAKRATNDRRSK
jgi:hypothetical protein